MVTYGWALSYYSEGEEKEKGHTSFYSIMETNRANMYRVSRISGAVEDHFFKNGEDKLKVLRCEGKCAHLFSMGCY